MDVESQATRTIVRLSGSTQPIWCYPTWSHLLPNDLKGVPHLLYVVRSPLHVFTLELPPSFAIRPEEENIVEKPVLHVVH